MSANQVNEVNVALDHLAATVGEAARREAILTAQLESAKARALDAEQRLAVALRDQSGTSEDAAGEPVSAKPQE